MGQSLQDRDRFDLARNLMKKAHEMGSEIMLPVDFMAGIPSLKRRRPKSFRHRNLRAPGWHWISVLRRLNFM